MALFMQSKEELHMQVGHAMERYANVEAHFAGLMGRLLKIDHRRACIIFFSVSNVRSRLEMIEELIFLNLKEDLKKPFAEFWDSSTSYFLTLATFRNAIAHWHPLTSIYVRGAADGTQTVSYHPGLSHPIDGRGRVTLHSQDITPFIEDCRYGVAILSSLSGLFKRRPRSLPDKFRKPIPYQNQAVLRPPPTTKAPQPRRQPSVPKLSSAQRRAKALKEAREKTKKK